ncbi:MAG: glycosyl hydrolase, partial [Bacteroidota bacterium]|nr:glycosyl hydrolase [Bacteroidota bacterium]
MKRNLYFLFICLCLTILGNLKAQEKSKKTSLEDALEGFTFRSIGPAFMSGRIADIAIDSSNENTWYVAAGSGGLWKTSNAGTTWTPLTDNESFYSTGCVTIDPTNSQKIWLGTGENVGGRHVGIGHGIFVSNDGGSSWLNSGLKESE